VSRESCFASNSSIGCKSLRQRLVSTLDCLSETCAQVIAMAADPNSSSRGLSSPESMSTRTTFSSAQNRAVLIAGLTCACVSFIAAFVALRWFVLMKKSFRHRLVLYLIASDTFKAVWYFVFAVVAISRGPVKSSSSFCQASGFFLALGVEATDFAILIIALHTLLSIFKPTSKNGEGGLYPFRHWIYPLWLGPPLLAASLAFINDKNAYVTSGTYCYLPKRPIWYRLALSWIPRYIIISLIFVMYFSIYIYVHVKFRGFGILAGGDDSSQNTASLSRQSVGPLPSTTEDTVPAESSGKTVDEESQVPSPAPAPAPRRPARPTALRMLSQNSILGVSPKPQAAADAPWDAMSFITARPLQDLNTQPQGITSEDFAQEAESTGSQETKVPARGLSASNGGDQSDDRKPSEAPTTATMKTDFTGETAATRTTFNTTFSTADREKDGTTDHLRQTRQAIRRQLRFLFIYPMIYVIMWSFPFAAHALNYDDYFVTHPIFWLAVVQTCCLALQAGVDSVVFSLREKPWRRIDSNSKWSIPNFKGRVIGSIDGSRGQSNAASAQSSHIARRDTVKRNSSHWWEAEGRRRKDSIWMGTDMLTRLTTNRDTRSHADEQERVHRQSTAGPEGSDRASTKSRK
jgi:G protein-coupled receptor GPR1